MAYVVRHTTNPTYDVQRNWSAWMSDGWATEDEAQRDIARLSPRYQSYADRFVDDNDDEVVARVIEDDGPADVRYHEANRRWYHVHHEGLSCYVLTAETEAEAWDEARGGDYDWTGFGEATVGSVRLVGQVGETLHLFECDAVTDEAG